MHSRKIEAYKRTLKLTQEQREVLVGILLGDASLESLNGGRTYRVKIEQSDRHRAYIRHLHALFRPWVLTGPLEKLRTLANGSQATSWAFQTVSHGAFRFYAHQFYLHGKKRVPKSIRRWLTPRGLAYWFMDDGSMKSRQSKGVVFNTQRFTRADVEKLIEVLRIRFGLNTKVRHQREGNQIYVSGGSFDDLQRWLDSYLIPEMRYKFPVRRTRLPKR